MPMRVPISRRGVIHPTTSFTREKRPNAKAWESMKPNPNSSVPKRVGSGHREELLPVERIQCSNYQNHHLARASQMPPEALNQWVGSQGQVLISTTLAGLVGNCEP